MVWGSHLNGPFFTAVLVRKGGHFERANAENPSGASVNAGVTNVTTSVPFRSKGQAAALVHVWPLERLGTLMDFISYTCVYLRFHVNMAAAKKVSSVEHSKQISNIEVTIKS